VDKIENIRNSVVILESNGKVLIDVLEVSKDVKQKVDKLQNTVDKLKFGDEVIKLVDKVSKNAKAD
jgi:hypothetical protein